MAPMMRRTPRVHAFFHPGVDVEVPAAPSGHAIGPQGRTAPNSLILSPRQREVFDFVVAHCDEQGYPPAVRDIAWSSG